MGDEERMPHHSELPADYLRATLATEPVAKPVPNPRGSAEDAAHTQRKCVHYPCHSDARRALVCATLQLTASSMLRVHR